MNDLLFTPIRLNELEILIENSVRKALNQNSSTQREHVVNTDTDILDVKQASKFLNLAIPTIYCLTSNRTLPHSKRGKKLYFSKTDLTLWIKSGKRSTVSELKEKAKGY